MVIKTAPQDLRGRTSPHLLPDNQATFFIGDIHGQWNALTSLLDVMGRAQTGSHKRVLVTTGDTIHKGPHSRRVLKSLLNGTVADRLNAHEHHALLGNHEILFARALIALEQTGPEREWIKAWGASNGQSLLRSWKKDRPGNIADRLSRWRDAFPSDLTKLAQWQKSYHMSGLIAVHAGVIPHMDWTTLGAMHAYSLARGRAVKNPLHWATVRAPFLDWTDGFDGKLIVHGHTPPNNLFANTPQRPAALLQNFDHSAKKGRLCLDGGAGFGIGIAGAIIQNGTAQFFFAPC